MFYQAFDGGFDHGNFYLSGTSASGSDDRRPFYPYDGVHPDRGGRIRIFDPEAGRIYKPGSEGSAAGK